MNNDRKPKSTEKVSKNEATQRAPKSNYKQRQYLIDFMATHDQLANRGKLGIRGNDKYKSMWIGLAATLNDMGPCRTWLQWVSAWQQIVRKSRDANGEAQLAMKTTGNPDAPEPLTNEDQKILSTIGKQTSSGMEETIPSLGFTTIIDECDTAAPDADKATSSVNLEDPIKSSSGLSDLLEIKGTSSRELSPTCVSNADSVTTKKLTTTSRQQRQSTDFVQSAMKRHTYVEELNETSKANLVEMKRMNNNFELWAPRLVSALETIAQCMQNPHQSENCTEVISQGVSEFLKKYL